MTDAVNPPSPEPAPSERTRVLRNAGRGRYDAPTVHAILDAAPICHVGYVTDDGQPIVIPMIHGRIDDMLYLHGAAGNAMQRGIHDRPVSVTATIMRSEISRWDSIETIAQERVESKTGGGRSSQEE